MLGIIDDGTLYHVVCQLFDHSPAGALWLFKLCWMSWAGPPVKIVCDQDKTALLGVFRTALEEEGVEFDYVLRAAHWAA